jgi:Asp-tRNA(Asn)/Glu-tRNA(Gln) amidotransferase A subunit family amidase
MSGDGLPVGMQLMAGPEREALMLGGAKTLEELYRFDERFRPKTQG